MINWTEIEKWRDALRTTKLKQHQLAMVNDNKRPTAACCLGVFQLEVQGRAASDFDRLVALDMTGVLAMGTYSTGDPKIFGRWAAELNDRGIAVEGIDPLTFDEIADLLDIALIERGDSIV